MDDKKGELIAPINSNLPSGQVPEMIQEGIDGTSRPSHLEQPPREWSWDSVWHIPGYQYSRQVECRRTLTNFMGPVFQMFRDLQGKTYFQLTMFQYVYADYNPRFWMNFSRTKDGPSILTVEFPWKVENYCCNVPYNHQVPYPPNQPVFWNELVWAWPSFGEAYLNGCDPPPSPCPN